MLVNGKCHGCGSPKLVVTQEGTENAIGGHCPSCGQAFSGFYVVLAQPVREVSNRQPQSR
jgi:hypothetical protein